MSKILIVMRGDINAKNGSAFHVRNMREVLVENGHEFLTLHCPDGPWDAPLCIAEMEKMKGMIEEVNPDAVIADYSWMCSAFDVVPDNVLKICFVHDLRCRIIPCLAKHGYVDTQNWSEERESVFLQKAKILMALSDGDAEFCKRMASDAKIIRIGISMKPVSHDPVKEIPGRCIYVGSNNMENKIALEWFVKEVWPKVKSEVPHASLEAVMGYSENIDDHYAEAQIAVVPHIMDGGLKIKTAEAFAHGLAVVGNICSFDGLEMFEGRGVFDDPKDISVAVIMYLTQLREAGKENWRRVGKFMTSETAYGKLLDILA